MNKMFIFIPGICANPEDHFAWTDRAEDWIDNQTQFKAKTFEYKTGVVFRRMGQSERVKDLIQMMASFPNFDIVLVGHSNGCDIISRTLKLSHRHIKEVHLIAAACEADCAQNGVNEAMKDGRLDSAYLYCSKSDGALKKAKFSSWLLGWIGLGYGSLGLTGPKNAIPGVNVLWMPQYDHSTWFLSAHFDDTMRRITRSLPKEKAT